MKLLQIVYITGVVFAGLQLCLGTLLALRRRDKYPIRQRSVPLMILLASALNLHFCMEPLPPLFDINECSPFILYYVGLTIAVTCILVRLWRLWFLYYSARERLDSATDKSRNKPNSILRRSVESANESIELDVIDLGIEATDTSEHYKLPSHNSDWFSRHRHWIRDSNLVLFVGGLSALFLIVLMVLYAVFIRATGKNTMFLPFPASNNCLAVQVVILAGSCFAWSMVTLVLFTAWFLRHVQDAYYMKFEFKMLFVAALGNTVPAHTLTALGYGSGTVHLVTFYSTQLFVASVLTIPVAASFVIKRSTNPSDSTENALNVVQVPAFEELLHGVDNDKFRNSFKEQLVREFCVENYIFYFAALNFENDEERSDMSTARAAIDIYQEFLIKNGRNEINISGRLRENIEDCLRASIVNFDRINAAFLDQQPSLFPQMLFGIDFRGSMRKMRQGSVARLVNSGDFKDEKRSVSYAEETSDTGSANISIRSPVSVHIFADAKNEIFELMRQDSYIKWKKAYRFEHAQ